MCVTCGNEFLCWKIILAIMQMQFRSIKTRKICGPVKISCLHSYSFRLRYPKSPFISNFDAIILCSPLPFLLSSSVFSLWEKRNGFFDAHSPSYTFSLTRMRAAIFALGEEWQRLSHWNYDFRKISICHTAKRVHAHRRKKKRNSRVRRHIQFVHFRLARARPWQRIITEDWLCH